MKRALITGITGQGDSYLAELLLDKGDRNGLVAMMVDADIALLQKLQRDR